MAEQAQSTQHPPWARILSSLVFVLCLIYIGNPTGGVMELLSGRQ